MKHDHHSDFDIVIIGSGIAGSALACGLGDSGLRIAIIEGQTLPDKWPATEENIEGYDLRVSALTLASQIFLEQLGAWQLIVGSRTSPYRHMHVWDAEGTGCIDFDATDIHQNVLGHIVENRLLVAALLRRLKLCGNVSLLQPVKLLALESINGDAPYYYRVSLDNGDCLRARLVVGADGANSLVRRLTEVKTREWDYGHHAIVATVKTQYPHQQTAWQRFLPEGPLAFLPLSTETGEQHFSSLVWSCESDHIESLLDMSAARFCQSLQWAFEQQLGDVQQVSSRVAFPLRQRHAIDYVRPGMALIADAAHTIHPLAGQGINLGLQDVRVLMDELQRAVQRQQDIGSLAILSRYQRRRKGHNLAMMAAMEGFKRLFAEKSLPVRLLRNVGMQQLNGIDIIKRQIIRQAMGMTALK